MSLQSRYVPHGMMIGAGLIALAQVASTLRSRSAAETGAPGSAPEWKLAGVLRLGGMGYLSLAAFVALAGGLASELSLPALAGFVLFAAGSAFVHELIVGLAAMHSGWFPAFAVALITLLIGMLLGFPPVALGLLTGLTVSTGPAFADMGYDLKAGWLLRGRGADAAFERDGREQQFVAAAAGFATALVVVLFTWRGYFARDLVAPVARVYVATIRAGVAPGVASALLLWAVPGALLQLAGGARRQLGVLLSTGLLIANVGAGWAVLAGLLVRLAWHRTPGRADRELEAVAAGFIAGDALFSFGQSILSGARPEGGRS
jgi:uncharacterized oligopeptide transporter (OPT) family protein